MYLHMCMLDVTTVVHFARPEATVRAVWKRVTRIPTDHILSKLEAQGGPGVALSINNVRFVYTEDL